MIVINTLSFLRKSIRFLHKKNKRIALVPTMGNLHDGHIKLIDKVKECDVDTIIVSIFVNPMQFDCFNDLACYPRTLQEDYQKLKNCHVDFIFAPSIEDMYPKGIKNTTYIDIPDISTILEGKSRPGHFRGVSTIVSKFFNLIQPDVACFGEKDYQQLILVRKMVEDMNYDITIVSIPTVRAKDGLALSSRNSYLSIEERKIAPTLNKVISTIAKNLNFSPLNEAEVIAIAKNELNRKGFRVDYLQIRDADTILKLTKNNKRAVILVAAWLGRVRLIDNKVVDLK